MRRMLQVFNRANDPLAVNERQSGLARRTLILVALCVVVPVLAGCSSNTESADLTDVDSDWQGGQVTASEEPNSPQAGVKNIALWALPLDEFVPDFSNVDNYAEQLLLASCLGNEGIDWPVPWQDIEEPTSPVFNPAGRRLFNTEIAEKYGFRTNLGPSKSAQLWESFLIYEPTEPGFQDAFDACLADIREEYPVLDTEDGLFVTGLVTQIQEEASLAPEVQEAADRWRSCMKPQGFGRLADPDEFPSTELQEELGSVPPLETVEPSVRELEVAMAHATCLDSSGYSAAMYDLEWKLQETAIERDRAKLDRIRNAVHARETAVREIIAANAPRA